MDKVKFEALRHRVNVAATKVDDELGAARADNPPVDGNPHIQAAHAALGEIGLAMLALYKFGMEDEPATPTPGPSPAGPAPALFRDRAGLDQWMRTQQQQVTLDGTMVWSSGFGPPMNWFTQADGTIMQTPPTPVTGGPDPAPAPGPVVVVPDGQLVGTVYRSGMGPADNPSGMLRWNASADTIYQLRIGDPAGKFSFTAGSGGVKCWVGRKPDLSDGLSQTGASPELAVNPGDVVYVRFTGGHATQGITASIPREK
jgi:hypothetical protein